VIAAAVRRLSVRLLIAGFVRADSDM